jgi:two-component sensor histidine kinase
LSTYRLWKFDLDRIVTLSLLVSELIRNALKDGLHGRDNGMISIKLERNGQSYALAIKDNGRSWQDNGDPAAGPTLGMTIIRSLGAQLGGTIAWSNGTGTTARLTFPA